MRYEMLTLDVKLVGAGAALAGVKAREDGRLGSCWTTEIGELNQNLTLAEFADDATLQAERQKLFAKANPLGAGAAIKEMRFETYAPFPWAPPPVAGSHGKVYEIRTYKLKHSGLNPTIAAWEAAMPRRSQSSPLSLIRYALDGAPHITQLWPCASLEVGAKARGDSVAAGAWQPKGGPDWLTGDMRSKIGLPAAFSPLS